MIDLKTRGFYIEGNKATMYRFFDDPKGQNRVFTYENIDPKCISLDKEIKVFKYITINFINYNYGRE